MTVRVAKLVIVESTTAPGRPSLRGRDGESPRAALLDAGFAIPGERVVVVAEDDWDGPAVDRARAASGKGPIEIVFDGPPGPESCRFVEVEQDGRSIRFGEWIHRGNGTWALRLPDAARLHTGEGHAGCDVQTCEIAAVASDEASGNAELVAENTRLSARVVELEAQLAAKIDPVLAEGARAVLDRGELAHRVAQRIGVTAAALQREVTAEKLRRRASDKQAIRKPPPDICERDLNEDCAAPDGDSSRCADEDCPLRKQAIRQPGGAS